MSSGASFWEKIKYLSVTIYKNNVIKSQTVKAKQILHCVQESHKTVTGTLPVLSTTGPLNLLH
jgi:hypothetical protein